MSRTRGEKRNDDNEYRVTLVIEGRGRWPFVFDTAEEAADQARAWAEEALKSEMPSAHTITFGRAGAVIDAN